MSVYDQPLSSVLSTGQYINAIVTEWTPEYKEQWAQTYPDTVDWILNDYSFCIITHPEFLSGVATQAQIDQANDIFASNWENLGQYASTQTISIQLAVFSSDHNLSGIDAVANNVSDEAILGISPQIWSSVIESITETPSFPPMFPNQDPVSVEQSNAVLRELMETLNTVTDSADNPVDITYVVNVSYLDNTLQELGYNGNLDGIDAIVDNLSSSALSFVSSNTWTSVIQSIVYQNPFEAPPSFEIVEQSNAALRELMETLSAATDIAGNPIDIADMVNVSYLANNLHNFGYNGNLDGIDAIVDNLSGQALRYIGSINWSNIIEGIARTPFTPPTFPGQDQVSVEQSNAALRELMETLSTATDIAGNPIDIADMIDVSNLDNVFQDFGINGNLDGIDAIVDNLSAQALRHVGPINWSYIIEAISETPHYPPTLPDQDQVGVEQANAALRELMETLSTATDVAGNPIDISYLVDISYLGDVLQKLGWNSNLGGFDAIIDNLSSTALTFINPSTWVNVISSLTFAPTQYPLFPDQDPVSVEQANAALRELMETLNTATDVAGNPVDITGVVDISYLGWVIEDHGYNGNLGGIDAIVDNLSAQALSFVTPNAWSNVIGFIADAPFSYPMFPDQDPASVEQANTALRELMETLNTATDAAGNLIDITNVVDVSYLGNVVDNIHQNGNGDGVAAIVENLSDTALETLANSSTVISDGRVEVASSGNDNLYGSNSDIDVNLIEAIYGLGGNDVILGGNGNTSSYGGDGDDIVYDLYGGDDIISGGDGSDQLYGGSGDDTFVFNKGETGVDTIYGFAEGDKIDLADLLSGYDPLTDAIEDFIVITQVDSSTQMVAVDADGTGAGSAVDVTSVNTSTGLDMNDFITTIDDIV